MGCAGVFLRGPCQGHLLQRPHRRRARARGGAGGLAFFLLLFTGAQPRGGWCSSTIARLQGFSSCSPIATSGRWSSTRMTTSLVVERSEPGCGLPPALSFKDVHHPCWGGGRAEAPPFARAGGPFLPPAFGGEGRPPALRRRQTSATRGRPSEAPSTAACLAPRPGWPWCRLRRCLLPLGRAWPSVHRTGDGRTVRRSATPTASPASPTAPGGCTRRRTPWGRRRRSWMVLSSLPR
jgi:hypothetical protein